MTSRRTVLQAGVGVPLILALQRVGFAAGGDTPQKLIAVVDERLAGSEPFAAQMNEAGARVLKIRGDVTSVWIHLLSEREQMPQTSLVGLTTEQSLFCLDQMTRSEGLRIVHRDSGAQTGTHALRQSRLRAAALPLQHGPALREDADMAPVCWAIARPAGDGT
jgi:hypothetical protein